MAWPRLAERDRAQHIHGCTDTSRMSLIVNTMSLRTPILASGSTKGPPAKLPPNTTDVFTLQLREPPLWTWSDRAWTIEVARQSMDLEAESFSQALMKEPLALKSFGHIVLGIEKYAIFAPSVAQRTTMIAGALGLSLLAVSGIAYLAGVPLSALTPFHSAPALLLTYLTYRFFMTTSLNRSFMRQDPTRFAIIPEEGQRPPRLSLIQGGKTDPEETS